MPRVVVCGRGGSGKSTLVALLARVLADQERVLVVDADESNLGLAAMLGVQPAESTLLSCLGGKEGVRDRLLASLRQDVSNGEKVTGIFSRPLTPETVPAECTARQGNLALLRIGKIQRSMEGCACPEGAVARSLLNAMQTRSDEWVLVDTEAGVEHFGRGLLEGADVLLVVVEPSREALETARRVQSLAACLAKPVLVVVNKAGTEMGRYLVEQLAQDHLEPVIVLENSPEIMRANLYGQMLDVPLWSNRLLLLAERLKSSAS
ncbi:MAG: ATP-binding protein [Desulfurispora sp.]|uniref:ATP-binding protein n=1 Tax=Desulfurispora sp. TaxID=3014275 RepID=UPI00404998E4